jgi:hypothetical protein
VNDMSSEVTRRARMESTTEFPCMIGLCQSGLYTFFLRKLQHTQYVTASENICLTASTVSFGILKVESRIGCTF